MGGIVKAITGPIIQKRANKNAYQAKLRGMEGAISEQESILSDITASQQGLRDDNIADIRGLAGQSQGEYDDAFKTVGDLLQSQFDQTSALQQGAFDSNEARLLANLDDVLARSQQSFDYAQENLMPYIAEGRKAFEQYAQQSQDGFDYQSFDEQFQAPEPFQYDDFQFDYEQSPGYQFARDQALDAATNTAAASGMGLSGATQKALQDRAAGLAAQDYGNQFNRAMSQYQMDRDRDYREYGDAYNRDFNEFGQRYNIDRANQAGAYENYVNQLNTLSNLGNIGLQGDQAMIERERSLANFESQAETALSQALSQNDFGRANAIIDNINTLTGGQGDLAMKAAQVRNQINALETEGVINQRTSAQGQIDNTRRSTGSNISNLQMGKGQAESDYHVERGKLQSQLVGGVIDGGLALGSAAVGGMGGFGGAGGLQGAMNGLNFGSELASMGAGSSFSPQAMNFGRTGNYALPQPQMMAQQTAMPMNTGGFGLQAVNYQLGRQGGAGGFDGTRMTGVGSSLYGGY